MSGRDRGQQKRGELQFSGERIVPGEVTADQELMHRRRYEFALPYVTGKRVLDLGCGEGYGSSMLAQKASSVVGVDISEEAVAHASGKYALDNLEFRAMPAERLSFPDGAFDVLVCFEVIEHVRDHMAVITETRRVLKPGGTLLLSTPNKNVSSPRSPTPLNVFHYHEFTVAEAKDLFRRHFSQVEFFSQRDPFQKSRKVVWNVLALDVASIRKLFPRFLKDRVKWRMRETLGETLDQAVDRDRWKVVPGIEQYSHTIVAVCRK